MDPYAITCRRTPDCSMGYLNYPPEIMNQIYQEVLVDHSQVLSFLCSPDPAFRHLDLKKAVTGNQNTKDLDWTKLYDLRYYINSTGLSAQFLRVCKGIWLGASPILYGNLTIAMRCTPKHPDPCLRTFFKRNTPYVLAWAKFIFPRIYAPWPTQLKGYILELLHWGATHPANEDLEVSIKVLRTIRAERLAKKRDTGRRIQGRST